MSPSNRIQKWDLLKLFLIFSVVLGHIADYYTAESASMRSLFLFIYSFHMPLFLFVSGLFSKRTVQEKRWDKIGGFLLIYILSNLLPLLYRYQGFQMDLLNPGGLPWFMLAMAAFPLVTYALRNCKPVYVLSLSVLLGLAVGFDPNITDFLALSRLVVFYPFYYLGYSLRPEQITSLTDRKWVKVLSALLLIAAAWVAIQWGESIYVMRYLFTGKNPYAFLGQPADHGVWLRLAAYGVSTLLGFAVIALIPNRTPLAFLARFGGRTLSVYFYHYAILDILYGIVGFRSLLAATPWGDSGYIILPLALILTWILSLKPFSVPLDFVLSIPKRAKKES